MFKQSIDPKGAFPPRSSKNPVKKKSTKKKPKIKRRKRTRDRFGAERKAEEAFRFGERRSGLSGRQIFREDFIAKRGPIFRQQPIPQQQSNFSPGDYLRIHQQAIRNQLRDQAEKKSTGGTFTGTSIAEERRVKEAQEVDRLFKIEEAQTRRRFVGALEKFVGIKQDKQDKKSNIIQLPDKGGSFEIEDITERRKPEDDINFLERSKRTPEPAKTEGRPRPSLNNPSQTSSITTQDRIDERPKKKPPPIPKKPVEELFIDEPVEEEKTTQEKAREEIEKLRDLVIKKKPEPELEPEPEPEQEKIVEITEEESREITEEQEREFEAYLDKIAQEIKSGKDLSGTKVSDTKFQLKIGEEILAGEKTPEELLLEQQAKERRREFIKQQPPPTETPLIPPPLSSGTEQISGEELVRRAIKAREKQQELKAKDLTAKEIAERGKKIQQEAEDDLAQDTTTEEETTEEEETSEEEETRKIKLDARLEQYKELAKFSETQKGTPKYFDNQKEHYRLVVLEDIEPQELGRQKKQEGFKKGDQFRLQRTDYKGQSIANRGFYFYKNNKGKATGSSQKNLFKINLTNPKVDTKFQQAIKDGKIKIVFDEFEDEI